MVQFKRLDHILITIPEGTKEQAKKFFTEAIELTEIAGEHPSGALWFYIGDIELHVREEAGGNFSKRHAAFEVEKLGEAKQFLQNKNIEIAYSSEIDGRERCFFRDPFGNRFELLEYRP